MAPAITTTSAVAPLSDPPDSTVVKVALPVAATDAPSTFVRPRCEAAAVPNACSEKSRLSPAPPTRNPLTSDWSALAPEVASEVPGKSVKMLVVAAPGAWPQNPPPVAWPALFVIELAMFLRAVGALCPNVVCALVFWPAQKLNPPASADRLKYQCRR